MGLPLLQHLTPTRAKEMLPVPCSNCCSGTAPVPFHGASWTPLPRHPTCRFGEPGATAPGSPPAVWGAAVADGEGTCPRLGEGGS